MSISEEAMTHALAKCKGTVEDNIREWLDIHEKEEFAKYEQIHAQLVAVQSQLTTVLRVFEQAKGALTLVRWLAVLGAGLWAFLVWAKDHIRL